MVVLIAEKPKMGAELARITGCRERNDGYYKGGYIPSGPLAGKECYVTWTIGHLLQIDQDANTAALHWKLDNLPVMPDPFLLKPRQKDGKDDPGYIKQLRVIETLFSKCEAIINCGDAGREGELIQRYVLQWCINNNPKCNKPVWRLWTSSMTDEALKKALSNIRPGNEYDNLYQAGKSRSEADWLVGINATEALTLTLQEQLKGEKRVFSLGRVQTPILALVCSRYLENQTFKPEPFWTVKLHTESKGQNFTVTSIKRFGTFAEANSLSTHCTVSMLTVDSVEKKPKTLKAPLLHDITSLQQEASRCYGLDPDETLRILQKLYEDKLVTYPRTGSQYITQDVFHTIPKRMMTLTQSSNPKIKTAALRLSQTSLGELNKNTVHDDRVTDHHALLVETTIPTNLTGKEEKVYNLVAIRMLEAFCAPCECEVLSVRFTCASEGFAASSTKTLKPGWKAVLGEPLESTGNEKKKDGEDNEQEEQKLPELSAGDILPVKNAQTIEGKTKPKPIYTMDTLLQAIKTAGKESEDEDIKTAMKGIGIGTPATRDSIIKSLKDVRHFIKKEKGEKILPTEMGLEVYNLVKDMAIANVEMTGRWEIALNMIAEGKMPPEKFNDNIRLFTRQITEQIKNLSVSDGINNAAEAENIKCPCCGRTVKVWDKNAKCTNPECGLYLNRYWCEKRLSEPAIKNLLENGKTGLIRGFKSKAGKTFDARLKLIITEKESRKYANVEPFFDDVKPKYKKYDSKSGKK